MSDSKLVDKDYTDAEAHLFDLNESNGRVVHVEVGGNTVATVEGDSYLNLALIPWEGDRHSFYLVEVDEDF